MILRPRPTFHHARGVVAMPAIVRRESIMAVKALPAGLALDAAGNEHEAFTATEYDAGVFVTRGFAMLYGGVLPGWRDHVRLCEYDGEKVYINTTIRTSEDADKVIPDRLRYGVGLANIDPAQSYPPGAGDLTLSPIPWETLLRREKERMRADQKRLMRHAMFGHTAETLAEYLVPPDEEECTERTDFLGL